VESGARVSRRDDAAGRERNAAEDDRNDLDNTCTARVTSCVAASDGFGQIIAVRAPREIQFGLKLYW
jgi:hypothetical protein